MNPALLDGDKAEEGAGGSSSGASNEPVEAPYEWITGGGDPSNYKSPKIERVIDFGDSS